MGITRGSAKLLLEEKKRRDFAGSVLQFGKMFVFFTDDELAGWAREHGVTLSEAEGRLSHQPVLAAHGCLSDIAFFERLGFDTVHSLDASAWEGANLIHDLNQPVPEAWHGRYDLVFEGGTMQSVFDVRQFFRSVHRLLKPGGRVVHAMTPSHNQVDLGFYMFSPTLFHDFYRQNGWQLDRLLLCEHVLYWVDGLLRTGTFDVYDYEPGSLDHLSLGRYGPAQLSIFAVATKIDGAGCEKIPQQSYFDQLWHGDAEAREQQLRTEAERVRPRSWRTRSGGLFDRYRRALERLRRAGFRRKMPRRIASY